MNKNKESYKNEYYSDEIRNKIIMNKILKNLNNWELYEEGNNKILFHLKDGEKAPSLDEIKKDETYEDHVYTTYAEMLYYWSDDVIDDINNVGLFDKNGDYNFYLDAKDIEYLKFDLKGYLHEICDDYIMTNNDYDDFQLSSLYYDPDFKQDLSIMAIMHSVGNDEEAIWFNPLKVGTSKVLPDWDYDIDTYDFAFFEEGFEIIDINMDKHYGIWCNINHHLEEIEHKEGMQKYLKYCKDNHITYSKIMTNVGKPLGMDIMDLYAGEDKDKVKSLSDRIATAKNIKTQNTNDFKPIMKDIEKER
ncbi:MAG: hypothetical protein RR945_01540 [Erysipelotrichaceae bacterium]